MPFTVVIPARYASKRLPGKPLLKLKGKPLIQRVFEKANRSKAEKVYVATDHKDILDCCKEFGGSAILTSAKHLTGTDRIAELVQKLGIEDDTVIVNLQGDEPFIEPKDIDNVAELLMNNIDFEMGTLFSKLKTEDEDNPNIVKIWVGQDKKVKAFSRKKDYLNIQGLTRARHLGIYSYRVGFIKRFVKWNQTKSEILESLEQLRAVEKNMLIGAMQSLSKYHAGIDTKEDLIKARSMIIDE